MPNRNNEAHFSQVPHENIRRSMFDRSHSHLTTINEGDLVPIYWDEIIPGDTVKIKENALIRMATPIYPVMDNCYCDFYWFFVPNRLTWEHWEEFMGENKSTYWTQPTDYTVPLISYTGGVGQGTIADYMGVPIGVNGLKVNALPFRAYALTWNEWFRDQNTQQPNVVNTGDATTIVAKSSKSDSYTSGNLNAATCGIGCNKVSRFHDYFSSSLPAPQKGSASAIPIDLTSATLTGSVPVISQAGVTLSGDYTAYKHNIYHSSGLYSGDTFADWPGTEVKIPSGTTIAEQVGLFTDDRSTAKVNFTTEANITINELRQAIAVQHLLETFARGGTRYREILRSCFGVTSPDERMQIPEYLGGFRLPININQVIQTSSTDSTSPQGNTAAYSCTSMSRGMFTKSFVEHGILLGLAAIRVDHSYQQGLERKWSRTDKFSYYWPQLANLGEMAVYNKEIYAQGTSTDDEVFGYQEAWADYRYHQNRISSEMRSTYSEPLDSWHYADYYAKLPTLSSSWLTEGTENIDRTLAVQSSLSHQFICDFYFSEQWTRPMPIYSVPGLQTI